MVRVRKLKHPLSILLRICTMCVVREIIKSEKSEEVAHMEVRTIGVVGAGTMGTGIAQTAAMAGYHVRLFDVNRELVEAAIQKIAVRLVSDAQKGKITVADSEAVVKRIRPSVQFSDFTELNYVIEAATERMEVKREIFQKLDDYCKPDTIFATNTSGLSVTEIASSTSRPDLVVGTHFFNPVPVMKLVEIVRGADTSEDAVEVAMAVCQRMGKQTIEVKDAPLFVVNRILVPMLNEAVFVLGEGLAAAADIDMGMRLGANHPIGPLALADLIGIDTLLLVAETLFAETGDPKYRPAPLLKQMVRAGKLGKKSGQGFYTYQ
jgi:3-hydroxybutyryl-CoA dehydrogenase